MSTSRRPSNTFDLVVPEKTGDVVAPATVGIGKKALSVPVTFPTVQGRYRLTVTLYDNDGVGYDAATQAMIPSLIVRVTGDFDGAIQAAPTAALVAGANATLGVRVINLGKAAWGHPAMSVAVRPPGRVCDRPARLRRRSVDPALDRRRLSRPTRRRRSSAPPSRSA